MNRDSWYARRGKRLLDLFGALAGLLFLSPVLALIAAAMKLLDPGPVFFRQTRAGRGFKPFTIYKFRSMRVESGRGAQITSDGDERITRLGGLLRKTKLDELPQLFNVLRGDMSLVGPRPTVPKYAEMFRAEYEVILSVKPGVTDYASIEYRDEEAVLGNYEEPEAGYMDDVLPRKIAHYRRYIAGVSLLTDLKILAATVAKVLRLHKSVALASFRSGRREVMIKPVVTHDRRMAVLALDLLIVLGVYALAFLLSFELDLEPEAARQLKLTAPYAVLSYFAASLYFGVNRGLRYYAGFGDVLDTLKAVCAAASIQGVLAFALAGTGFPRPVLLLWPILALVGVAGLHACVHGAGHYLQVRLLGSGPKRSAVIVGVGDLGELVYQNMRSDGSVDYRVAAFFDEGRVTCGVRLHGVPVVGTAADLAAVLRRAAVDELVVAVSRDRRAKALSAVGDALQGLERRPEVLVMPALDEMLKEPKAAARREVQACDLLDRRMLPVDAARIGRSLAGKVVLVTGAGGTIGGELARQVVLHKPKKVILLDNHATALFYRETELRQNAGGVEVVASLGDVRDLSLLDRIFLDERPEVVFHSAAHKHVYQLETNVHEGVSNNLLATYHLASAADRNGVETFILVSTDKAERPTCVMGATKRAAEVVVSTFARKSKTRFAAVRFGNVLGTSGSVIKLFQEKIEKGRPLTLTQPDAARYFMTVEEAAGLILEASTLAKGGEVFALKMGERIPVMDLARGLVRLAGLDPDRDVRIRSLGPETPENPALEAADHRPSEHPAIMVVPAESGRFEGLANTILSLDILSYTAGKDVMLRALTELVPTFIAPWAPQDFRIHPAGDSVDPSPN